MGEDSEAPAGQKECRGSFYCKIPELFQRVTNKLSTPPLCGDLHPRSAVHLGPSPSAANRLLHRDLWILELGFIVYGTYGIWYIWYPPSNGDSPKRTHSDHSEPFRIRQSSPTTRPDDGPALARCQWGPCAKRVYHPSSIEWNSFRIEDVVFFLC